MEAVFRLNIIKTTKTPTIHFSLFTSEAQPAEAKGCGQKGVGCIPRLMFQG